MSATYARRRSGVSSSASRPSGRWPGARSSRRSGARAAGASGGMPAASYTLVEGRRHGVEVARASVDEAGVAQAEVVDDRPADVAARDDAVLVAEHVVHERVEVDGERGDVVEAVGREARVAVAAQVGRDHLEAGVGERLDVAPPDALRLRVAVHEQQRSAADALAHVRERHAVARRRRAYGRGMRSGSGALVTVGSLVMVDGVCRRRDRRTRR